MTTGQIIAVFILLYTIGIYYFNRKGNSIGEIITYWWILLLPTIASIIVLCAFIAGILGLW